MYKKLLLANAINVVVMYLITYVMVDQFSHLLLNINRFYMALLMAFPMIIVMILIMRSMYKDARLNTILIGAAVVLFILVFAFVRTQTPIGDRSFLRSMIPHHSSAILMCQEADISDPEIAALCEEIIETQREEIAQMQDILARY